MSKRLTIHRDEKPIYDIVIENSFDQLASEIKALGLTGRKFCIVTDSTVAKLYLKEVHNHLCSQGVTEHVTDFVFNAGEQYKTLDTVKDLYETLILNHFERKDICIALGGGVVGDLTGYASATYLRGIDFIQVPTTLLAQVDSSIGGKTGVDFDAYKNMVGAFHMPRLVYMNLATLHSLDERIYLSGYGEIIKHAYIQDANYLTKLHQNMDGILCRDLQVLEEIIYRSCQIKGHVVEIDPTEKFERMLLNYGHTLGHAIEKLSGFNMYHGECVVLGMVAALRMGVDNHELEPSVLEEALALFTSMHFAVKLPEYMNPKDIITTSRSDKKMSAGHIRFVMLHGIGEGYVNDYITEEMMEKALKGMA